MAGISFIQRSRIGRGIFLLRDDLLEVTILSFGIKSTNSYPLRSIEPDYELVAQRFWILILVPLVISAALMGLTYVLVSQQMLPKAAAIYSALFALAFAIGAIRGVPRVERFLFFDHGQKPRFYIVRERHQTAECEAFLLMLVERIEQHEHGAVQIVAPTRPAVIESSVSLPNADGVRLSAPGENRWKIAIVSGLVSAGFPILATDAWVDFTLLVVLLATGSGLSFGVGSFVVKERWRWLSLIGMALSFVAPLFY